MTSDTNAVILMVFKFSRTQLGQKQQEENPDIELEKALSHS